MNISILLWILLSSFVGAVGNSLLKMASNIDISGHTFLQLSNSNVLKKLGLFASSGFFYALGFVLWGFVLSKSTLSKSYPLYIAFTFLFITAISLLFLGEHLSLKIVIGYILIITGILVIL